MAFGFALVLCKVGTQPVIPEFECIMFFGFILGFVLLLFEEQTNLKQ